MFIAVPILIRHLLSMKVNFIAAGGRVIIATREDASDGIKYSQIMRSEAV
ncbi:hypothetical protein HDC91_002262 [Mucilaginibacter sp. AK015]|nr:hypothetical protein [Mucilaginibacter sp. AK015]